MSGRDGAQRQLDAGGPARVSILMMAVALLVASTGAKAADPISAEQIINALAPKPVTRSLTMTPPEAPPTSPEQTKFLDSVRNRPTRSLTLDERQELATVAKDKPSIDIDIDFDYNSAQIGATATPGITALGKALSSPQLANGTFLLAGHTDGKGSDASNQDLSERRAEAVKRYLIARYKLPAVNLISVGYGKSMLKNKDNPLAAENRRVQVVNMANKNVAGQ
jgi:outer membrane protein OmpA-like peptidoglycan-associated protein